MTADYLGGEGCFDQKGSKQGSHELRAEPPCFPAPHALAESAALGSDSQPQPSGEQRPMIHVLAMITAKPGMRDAILKEFHDNMPAVHAEKGCIEYGPAIDAEGIGSFQTRFGPDSFVVIEKWESPEALKAHAASPHMAAYGAKTRDMIASRVIHVLSPG
jgi:quinol monooxygenase YgiN